jgi:hypothetical protein
VSSSPGFPSGQCPSVSCLLARTTACGYDVGTTQQFLGDRHLRTTMVYTHVLNRGGPGVSGPSTKPEASLPGRQAPPRIPRHCSPAKPRSFGSLRRSL